MLTSCIVGALPHACAYWCSWLLRLLLLLLVMVAW